VSHEFSSCPGIPRRILPAIPGSADRRHALTRSPTAAGAPALSGRDCRFPAPALQSRWEARPRRLDPFANSGRGGPPRSTSAVLARGYKKPRASGEPKARPLTPVPAFQGGDANRGSGLTPERSRLLGLTRSQGSGLTPERSRLLGLTRSQGSGLTPERSRLLGLTLPPNPALLDA
jgi:hypothetical protein